MRTYIGIDIGKKKCDVCVTNGAGKVLERRQYKNTLSDARELAAEMAKKYAKKGKCLAACETTASMWNITFGAFEEVGIDIKLANTFKMAIIAKTGKKTDKVDAEKIAHVLRMDMIPECYVPSRDVRGIRTMVNQRVKLARDRTRVINRVHNLLDRHDNHIDASSLATEKAIKQMESMELNSIHDKIVLEQSARQIRHSNEEIAIIEQHIAKEASRNKYAKLIASMTGMGIYFSLLLAVNIADIRRFKTPKNLASWAGLCPTIYQSGDKTYMGRMKKMDTSTLVNWAMIEAATTAVLHDDRMKVVYESAKRRHANKHGPAVVAVANKMITIIWHMLVTNTPYSTRNKRLYLRKLARLEKARHQ